MWRLLHTILNPVGALFWYMARKIDGWFSPVIGVIAAALIALWAISMSGALVYMVKDEIGRSVGLIEPVKFTTTSGVVQAISEETRKKLTVKQKLIVDYERDGQTRQFEGSVTESMSSAHEVGDVVTVYLPEGGAETLKDPADRSGEIAVSIIAMVFSIVALFLGWRYFAYRRRIFTAARDNRIVVASVAPQAPILRGNTRVLSTAERMKADAERTKRAIGK